MTQDNGASAGARDDNCSCGGALNQPADHHDISCPASLNPEPDMSWFLIAVGRRKINGYRDIVILDYSEGWGDFCVEFYWEDTFSTEPPTHLQPGAYRWSGYTIGFWDEDDNINVTGGTFTRDSATQDVAPTPGDPQ